VPGQYEFGDGCEHCWGEGEVWAGYSTPKYVIATFVGVEKSDEPYCESLPDDIKGLSLTLTQDPEHPCHWFGTKVSDKPPQQWMVAYTLGPESSHLVGSVDGGPCFFIGLEETKCKTSFTNAEEGLTCYSGGSANVT